MKKIALVIISFLMSQGLLGSEEYLDNLPVINPNELDEINLDKLVDEEKAKLHGQNNTNCGMSLEELAALVDTENPPNTSSCEPESNSEFDDLTKALEDNLISIPEEEASLTEVELNNLRSLYGYPRQQNQPDANHISPSEPVSTDKDTNKKDVSEVMNTEDDEEDDCSDTPVSGSTQEPSLNASAKKDKTQSKSSPHICQYCGKSCYRLSHLRIHERIHTGEKPFPCQHCGKSFARSNDLKRHETTHTGEKPFPCQHCGTSFSRSNDLKRHETTHTGEKLTCKDCGKSFSRAHNLRKHERTHQP